MTRARSAFALKVARYLVPVLIAGCIPGASTEKYEDIDKQEGCQIIDGKKYCFPRNLIYTSGKGGFLFEMPLGALDDACNRSRKLYPFVNVLFSEGHIPTHEVTKEIYPKDKVKVFKKEGFLFRGSIGEYDHCYFSKDGRNREICDRTVNWRGIYLSFEYDAQCFIEVREFSKNLEKFLERGRR